MFVSERSDPRQMMRQVAESEFRDDSSDDDSTSQGAAGGEASPETKEDQLAEPKEFSVKEAARATNCVGYVVLCILLFLGGILSILTHFYVQGEEEENFEQGFNVTANGVLAAVDRNTALAHASLSNLARLFPSHADSTEEMAPFLTVQEFDDFAAVSREITGARSVSYCPFIWDELARTSWEGYSVTEQSWMERSTDAVLEPIPNRIWLRDGNGVRMVDPGPAPYAPLWQVSPIPVGDTSMINFNMASDASVEEWITVQLEQNTSWSILTRPGYHSMLAPSSEQLVEPTSLAWIPVLESRSAMENVDEPQVSGALVADLAWTTILSNVLPFGHGAVAVVVDSCGLQHSYNVQPTEATYLGEGDFHDTGYEYLVVQGILGTFAAGRIGGSIFCKHKISVYPTKAYEETYATDSPHVFAVGSASCFLFAIILFLFYDGYVRIKQEQVVGHAERSQALVSSLFPGKVARLLFETNSRRDAPSALDQSNHSAHLLNFITKSERRAASGANSEERPIAELFPEATVMFADIAGFTAWSSIREPTQVFQLLESIFQAFDEEARKAGVFKVETVGDCYVSVCGVPEACVNHAEVMASFARECLYQFNRVVRDLELKLGPDTGDLALRIGLNSGPVTAGVLRGERARFQLFGDTVNTASRIETTGQRDRVHVSEHTAKVLIAAGKENWVIRRQDPVQAKGKGLINTFWLVLDEDARIDASEGAYMSDEQDSLEEVHVVSDNSTAVSSKKDRINPHKPSSKPTSDATIARKTERLVAWNTELLLQLLKHIVARRNALTGRKHTSVALTAMAQNISSGGMVVDEVSEIISLPDFDERLTIKAVDVQAVKLSPEVESQTRRFVSLIASMYRDNPFHNFEHASHVTMSVSKLLSRIIAPTINKESVSLAKQQEELILHDHTYGITSDPLTQFSVVLSALIHDVDHRGVPNFILQEEDKFLASVYNNKSIAEQNSVDLAWNTLMEPEFEALRCTIFCDIGELKRFRQLLVNSVIATDIFDKELSTLRKNRWAKAFSVEQTSRTTTDVHRMATIVIEHLIQASDVAHTMQHWHVYKKWNERLFKEMYEAYKRGRWDKDPSENWYQGEIGFFDNYIIPLAKKLKECGVFGVSSDEYLNYAMENRLEWEAKGESVVADYLQKYSGGDGETIGLVL